MAPRERWLSHKEEQVAFNDYLNRRGSAPHHQQQDTSMACPSFVRTLGQSLTLLCQAQIYPQPAVRYSPGTPPFLSLVSPKMQPTPLWLALIVGISLFP